MKIRVQRGSVIDFLQDITGRNGADVKYLTWFLHDGIGILYIYDHLGFLSNLIEPDTGKSSEVLVFPEDPYGANDWTIINVSKISELISLIRDGLEEGSIELPSGSTEIRNASGWKEVPYKVVNVSVTKFPKMSGFTDNEQEISYLHDKLSESDEYIASNDSENVVHFIISRHDYHNKFYISFEEDYTQASILTPQELAEEIDMIFDDMGKE